MLGDALVGSFWSESEQSSGVVWVVSAPCYPISPGSDLSWQQAASSVSLVECWPCCHWPSLLLTCDVSLPALLWCPLAAPTRHPPRSGIQIILRHQYRWTSHCSFLYGRISIYLIDNWCMIFWFRINGNSVCWCVKLDVMAALDLQHLLFSDWSARRYYQFATASHWLGHRSQPLIGQSLGESRNWCLLKTSFDLLG